jgi:hypothetical protein
MRFLSLPGVFLSFGRSECFWNSDRAKFLILSLFLSNGLFIGCHDGSHPSIIKKIDIDLYANCFEWPGIGVAWQKFPSGSYILESTGKGNNPIMVYYIDINNMGRGIGVIPNQPVRVTCSGEVLVAFWIDSHKADNSGSRDLIIKDSSHKIANRLTNNLLKNCFEWPGIGKPWEGFEPGTYTLKSSGPPGSNNPIFVYYIDSNDNGKAIGILPGNPETIQCSGEILVAFWIDSFKQDNKGNRTLTVFR